MSPLKTLMKSIKVVLKATLAQIRKLDQANWLSSGESTYSTLLMKLLKIDIGGFRITSSFILTVKPGGFN
jgi:hypothetical protein